MYFYSKWKDAQNISDNAVTSGKGAGWLRCRKGKEIILRWYLYLPFEFCTMRMCYKFKKSTKKNF